MMLLYEEIRQNWAERKPETFIQLVPEGELLPFAYGLAWRDWKTAGIYTAPMPLNVLIGWGRRAWSWIRFTAAGRNKFEDRLFIAFQAGRREGAGQSPFGIGGGR